MLKVCKSKRKYCFIIVIKNYNLLFSEHTTKLIEKEIHIYMRKVITVHVKKS